MGRSIDREKTLGLNANQSGMCKLASRDAEKYKLVEGMITELANDAVLAGKTAARQAKHDHLQVDQVQIFNISVDQSTFTK